MTYTPKPGSGSLFRNDRKEKDSHPDYRGDLCLPDGSTVKIAGWIKAGAKGKFLSISIEKPRPQSDGDRFPGDASTPLAGSDADDPFATPF